MCRAIISFDDKGAIMARPLRIAHPEAFNCITSQGNERKDIFTSQSEGQGVKSALDSCCGVGQEAIRIRLVWVYADPA